MPHDHAARIARQAATRFRGNVRPALEDGLARRVGIRQDDCIDVDDDLVALPGSARVEVVVEGALREQGQRVRLVLRHG